MKEIHVDFASDVTVVQLERLTDVEEGNSFWWADVVPHLCVLHERLIHDTEQCRRRIRDHPYIFHCAHQCVRARRLRHGRRLRRGIGGEDILEYALERTENDQHFRVKGPRFDADLQGC
jgi:hypothetical protein